MHNWIGNKMYLPTLKGEYEFKHEWFSEGFTEYYSRKVLYDQSLIPKEYYVELLNKDLVNIENNPSANETYEEIAARENFGSAQKKLSYYRGVLIALRWDHQLQGKGSSLKEMMLHLYSISKTSDGKISYSDIYSYGEKYTLNFKEDIEAYIINGEKLRLEPGAIVAYQIANQKIKLFDPGFDVQKSAKEKVIQGVNPKGQAYKAGLRNGMQYVKRKNSNRWSNSWSEKLPYTITVIDNRNEKTIEFFPYGETVTVQLYQKK
jgi:predicted metalloprotease with PDZ domain